MKHLREKKGDGSGQERAHERARDSRGARHQRQWGGVGWGWLGERLSAREREAGRSE